MNVSELLCEWEEGGFRSQTEGGASGPEPAFKTSPKWPHAGKEWPGESLWHWLVAAANSHRLQHKRTVQQRLLIQSRLIFGQWNKVSSLIGIIFRTCELMPGGGFLKVLLSPPGLGFFHAVLDFLESYSFPSRHQNRHLLSHAFFSFLGASSGNEPVPLQAALTVHRPVAHMASASDCQHLPKPRSFRFNDVCVTFFFSKWTLVLDH